jgi:hypothetical protein
MSSLPRVSEITREQVAREFDDFGPAACTARLVQYLERGDPELLDMILRCANDVGHASKIMTGFAMFYRLLLVEASSAQGGTELNPLPRVSPDTRDELVRKIDEQGPEAFAMETIDQLERNNPELLQMAHRFASTHHDYLRTMQGFALLYQSLLSQLSADRTRLH